MLKLGGSEERLHVLGLYALLHDVGKVTLRFAKRCVEGVEPCLSEDVAKAATRLIEEFHGPINVIANRKHWELSDEFVGKILGRALSSRDREYVDSVIAKCDRLAASERGLFSESIERIWGNVERRVSTGLALRYSHEVIPLLSPTWILLKTNYLDYVGLNALLRKQAGRWLGSEKRVKLSKELFYPIIRALDEGDSSRFSELLYSTIRELADEELWLPVVPITPNEISNLKALRLREAMERSSYSRVVLLLYAIGREVFNLLGGRVSRGLVDTFHNLLKATTLLVPSAVYWSLLPDISLYSHSKLVAAYTYALQLSSKLRLLTIDVNRIQDFISSPIRAVAASRVMRGRSLLVELALDSLVEYALTLFGGLPWTNVLISEGGTADLLIPDLPDHEVRVSKLREVASSLAHYLGSTIGFTVAYSNPFSVEGKSFIDTVKALSEGRRAETFAEVLESLSLSLATVKSKVGCSPEAIHSGGVIARESEVRDFDAITLEPVLEGEKDLYKLTVTEDSKAYADSLAPGKLLVGESISTPTHLSLVAGSIARELTAVVSVHLYRFVDNLIEPDRDGIIVLKEMVSRVCRGGELLCTYARKGWEFRVSLIPLPDVGALHILVATPSREEPYNPENPELLARIYEALQVVLEDIESALSRVLKEGSYSRIRISLVNAPHAFIAVEELKLLYGNEKFAEASLVYRDLRKSILKLTTAGVDVSLGYIFTNSYHPAQLAITKEGEVKGFRLVDLDEYGIIAVAKMDIDLFGEVRSLYSISPSRLVTLSDLVNFVVAGKAYLKALELARRLRSRYYNVDVIPLYAGGDDITVYGKWSHVVKYVAELYKEVRSVLKPLTFSLAIALGDCNMPILLLYRDTTSLLKEYAKEVKASCVLGAPTSVLYVEPQQAKPVVSYVVPLERPSKYYPWVDDLKALWNLQLLAELVDPVAYIEGSGTLTKLEELKRELHILSRIAYEYGRLVSEEVRSGGRAIEGVVPIEILYAYVWSRRRESLSELKKILEENVETENRGLKLLAYPDDIVSKTTVEEALKVLLASKSIVDLVLLALRRLDTVEPSKLIITYS